MGGESLSGSFTIRARHIVSYRLLLGLSASPQRNSRILALGKWLKPTVSILEAREGSISLNSLKNRQTLLQCEL